MNRPNILFALSSISLFLLVLVKYYVTSPIYKLLIELLLLSIAIFLTLMIIIELVLAIKNRFQRKRNLLLLVVMVITSFSIFYIIFRINVKVPLRGKVVLVAQREGAANCMTTITFNKNEKYYEEVVCFGISETVGTYKMKNDTIWFKDDEDNKEDKLKFALLKSNELVLYYKTDDKQPLKMSVIFNDL